MHKVFNVPYRVINFSDRDVILKRVVPLYTVNTVNQVFQEHNDPREETIPVKDFLELSGIEFGEYPSEQRSLNFYQLGCLKGYEYKIYLMDDTPVKQRYRPINLLHYKRLQEQLRGMLQTGVIKECVSPWASPVTIAEKSDGDIRLCE